ncbi:MAG: DUF507 family protein [Campylobacterales bacterium]|uniref:Uncharacterized protein n=1 Tax=Sulfurospirillum deleyianum (strain ATCC 51133 / DSM 6946 / 5175) TaxID=525898 RepID=D1B4B9_SULD5|nr:DUF507 family protein [Sulfurospirillum deleyianum]ACZ12939.1 protein of unknown function DUF507 [Sulfurospirillum deleyianum DSM 6946]MBN1840362.1 DUF507 family protein [Campylobacterales bacterium]MBN2832880.1 DUF507 family protein [Campylobacterales bacterium]
MKIRLPHAPYIANKIAIDILNCGFVTMFKGLEPVVKVAEDLIVEDIKKETALEERVIEILDQNEDEMEFQRVDRRNMFWLIKKKLAREFGVILSYEDRYNEVAHKILETCWKQGLIEYNVSENRIKNVVYMAIEAYVEHFQEIENEVADKIANYKRKLVPGSEEYDLIFEKLYEEELRRRGMLS